MAACAACHFEKHAQLWLGVLLIFMVWGGEAREKATVRIHHESWAPSWSVFGLKMRDNLGVTLMLRSSALRLCTDYFVHEGFDHSPRL